MNSRSRARLLFFLLPGLALAAPIFPPGTTYVLAPGDPVTASVSDIPLWPGVAPGSEGVAIQESVEESTVNPSRAVRGVTRPAMQAFKAVKTAGVAVLVLPGGGYRQLVWDKEGVEAARWLNGLGIDAFVLKYRLPDEGHSKGRFVPLQDAQRALRLIRARRPGTKIGMLGFSAGGHLAGVLGTRFATHYYEPVDRVDGLWVRPDFLVLVYAPSGGVFAFPFAAERVRLVNGNSIPSAVNAKTPPVFIVHGADDDKVPASDAQDIYAAFREAGVPAELQLLPGAGHGFGLRGTGPGKEWPLLCAAWMRRTGVLAP